MIRSTLTVTKLKQVQAIILTLLIITSVFAGVATGAGSTPDTSSSPNPAVCGSSVRNQSSSIVFKNTKKFEYAAENSFDPTYWNHLSEQNIKKAVEVFKPDYTGEAINLLEEVSGTTATGGATALMHTVVASADILNQYKNNAVATILLRIGENDFRNDFQKLADNARKIRNEGEHLSCSDRLNLYKNRKKLLEKTYRTMTVYDRHIYNERKYTVSSGNAAYRNLRGEVDRMRALMDIDYYATTSWLKNRPSKTNIAIATKTSFKPRELGKRIVDTLGSSNDYAMYKIKIPEDGSGKHKRLSVTVTTPNPSDLNAYVKEGSPPDVMNPSSQSLKREAGRPSIKHTYVKGDNGLQVGNTYYVLVKAKNAATYSIATGTAADRTLQGTWFGKSIKPDVVTTKKFTGYSSPKIDSISIHGQDRDNRITAGETVTVDATVTNKGSTADRQSIALSLSQIDGISNAKIVSDDLRRGNAKIYNKGYKAGAHYGNSRIKLKYPLMEASKADWQTGETHHLKISFRTRKKGKIPVYIKSIANRNDVRTAAPSAGTGDVLDQQGEWDVKKVINVEKPTTSGGEESTTTTPIITTTTTHDTGSSEATQEREPNGEPETATHVSIGETVSGKIGTEGDGDYYSFHATKGQTITVKGDSTPDLGQDESLDFIFPEGNLVGGRGAASVNEAGGSDTASVTASENGTYYLYVEGSPSTTTSYKFTLRTPESGGQEREPNGGLKTATPVSIGETVSGKIGTEGDGDYYSFHATKGQTITAKGTSTSNLGQDEQIELTFPSGNLVGGRGATNIRETGGSNTASFTASENGTYYLYVDGSRSTTGSYKLTFTTQGGETSPPTTPAPPTTTTTTVPTTTEPAPPDTTTTTTETTTTPPPTTLTTTTEARSQNKNTKPRVEMRDYTGDGTQDIRIWNGKTWAQFNGEDLDSRSYISSLGRNGTDSLAGPWQFKPTTRDATKMQFQSTKSFEVAVNSDDLVGYRVVRRYTLDGTPFRATYTVYLPKDASSTIVRAKWTNLGSQKVVLDQKPSHIHDGIMVMKGVKLAHPSGSYRFYVSGGGTHAFSDVGTWQTFPVSGNPPYVSVFDDENAVTYALLNGSTNVREAVTNHRPPRLVDFMVQALSLGPQETGRYTLAVGAHKGGPSSPQIAKRQLEDTITHQDQLPDQSKKSISPDNQSGTTEGNNSRSNSAGRNHLKVTKDENGIPDGKFDYRFSVTGELKLGDTATDKTKVDSNTVDAIVGPKRGTADYYFTGHITNFSFEGDPNAAAVYLNGNQIDPSKLGEDNNSSDNSKLSNGQLGSTPSSGGQPGPTPSDNGNNSDSMHKLIRSIQDLIDRINKVLTDIEHTLKIITDTIDRINRFLSGLFG